MSKRRPRAEGQVESTSSAERGGRWSRLLPVIGLVLALGSPALQHVFHLGLDKALPTSVVDIASLLIMWVVMSGVLWMAHSGEGIALSEFGFRRYDKDRRIFIREFVFAALFGIGLTFLLGILSAAVRTRITGEAPVIPEDLSTLPSAWFFGLAWITGSFTEEVLFRSYAIERLIALNGRRWLAGLVTALLFTGQHFFGWDWIHVVTFVLPGAIALTLIYLWRRSLFINVVVHAAFNLPILVTALALPFLR